MERRNQTSADAMTASPSRDFRAQGMKKDLYPHGSRELVDPKKHPASEHDRPPSNRTRPRS